jgi:hypothetical protein
MDAPAANAPPRVVRLRAADSGQEFVEAYFVDEWSRDTIGPTVASTSSGPKAYLKNEIRARFEADPLIESAMMLVMRGYPLVLWRVSDCWVDASGVVVEVSSAPRA